MKHVLKRIVAFLAIGGVLGDILTMLFAPSFITWFHTPVGSGAMCNCAENARAVATDLVNAQLVVTGLGGVFFAVVAELVVRLWDSRKHRRELMAASSANVVPASSSSPSTTSTQ
ncbi:MAG TPA: hypothetical protein VGO62_19325 [Myxococcota bacterium]|jgi:hypothetical protein